MTEKPSRSPRSLPILNEVPPPPAFDPAEMPSKRSMYWQMFWNVTRKVVRVPISLHTFMSLRRTILPQILPDELLYRWKPYQKGTCNRCGACCQVQFQCTLMIQDDEELTHCPIYQTEHVPKACLTFPIDPFDFHMLQREIDNRCIFYYEGAPPPIAALEFWKTVGRHLIDRSRKARKRRKRRPALETID